MSISISEEIAILALETFTSLPSRCKPRTLPDGRKEWTPMSAVVLNSPIDLCSVNTDEPLHEIKIVSLATGTKSLPVSALPKCNGLILHDSHAEVLALRGLNYWLLSEMERLLGSKSYRSAWLEFNPSLPTLYKERQDVAAPPFRFRKGAEISLFSTEAPCGDASMELLMSATEAAGRDITPWPTTTVHQSGAHVRLPPGRGCFSELGALRRKPARADAEVSMSKSCTDKLLLKQFTGLLTFPANSLVDNSDEGFLRRMIVYSDRWNETGFRRAFSADGRLKSALPAIESGETHRARFFDVDILPQNFRRFDHEKSTENQQGQKARASNISALWVAGSNDSSADISADMVEVILNGVKQGFKQFDDREGKGSVVCRKRMLQKGLKLGALLCAQGSLSFVLPSMISETVTHYSKLKIRSSGSGKALLKRKILKELGGWPRKAQEDDFVLAAPPPAR